MKSLRIVFMGTPEFAVASLNAIVNAGYNVVGVVTSPDKPAGRGQSISESDVKKYALTKGLPILQPTNLKSKEFLDQLSALNADLQIVVAFRMLPKEVWVMPRLGTFNLHASLLPQYRGAAPINWAVIKGETETGVTTFYLNEKIDEGAILFSERTVIPDHETAGELHDRLKEIGARLVVHTIDAISNNTINPTVQNIQNPDLKPAPKIHKETCQINWNKSGIEIVNFVRGLSPYPAAVTQFYNENECALSLKVFSVEFEKIEHQTNTIGCIVTDNKSFLKVAIQGGFIKILELQQSGKKKMNISDFLKGFRSQQPLSVFLN